MTSRITTIVMVAIVMIAIIGAGCTSTSSSNSMSNAPSADYQKATQGTLVGERTFTATVKWVEPYEHDFLNFIEEKGYSVDTNSGQLYFTEMAYDTGDNHILIANSSQGCNLEIGGTYTWTFRKYSGSDYWTFASVAPATYDT